MMQVSIVGKLSGLMPHEDFCSLPSSTGQYPAQYPDGGVVAQPSMMQPPLQTTTMPYYDPLSHHNLSHLGMHHGDHGGPITHSTRAHPQTVRYVIHEGLFSVVWICSLKYGEQTCGIDKLIPFLYSRIRVHTVVI